MCFIDPYMYACINMCIYLFTCMCVNVCDVFTHHMHMHMYMYKYACRYIHTQSFF